MRFDSKVALITGSAHGMGKSHTLNFVREGANVIEVDIATSIPETLAAKTSSEDLDQVVNEINGTGRKAIGLIADTSKNDEVEAAIDECISEFGMAVTSVVEKKTPSVEPYFTV